MINKKVARKYTLALYEIAAEQKSLDKVKEDFAGIKKTIETSNDLRTFLQTPIISYHKKELTIKALFEGKVSAITLKFLELLCQKGREMFLLDICIDFADLLNEKRGVSIAKVKTAIEITDTEKKALSKKLEGYTGQKIEADFTVDASIKGGFIAQINDTIIDASIKRQLEMLHDQFKKGSFSIN